MPSAKCPWSGSRLVFANGSTASDGRSGGAGAVGAGGAGGAGAAPGTTRYARMGRAMFLSRSSPRGAKAQASLPAKWS
jgi:hypothetical protein